MKIVAAERRLSFVADIALISAFIGLMTIAANIRIPLFFTPVPLTTQTLVLFLSIIYLRHKALHSIIGYFLLGVSGVPVFSNSSAGFAYLAGPTGGYILSWIPVAFVLPRLLAGLDSFKRSLCIFTGAGIFILSLGTFWLMFIYRLSFSRAVIIGFMPFITGDFIKAILASCILCAYKRNPIS
ncbi:MAG: biotin transporter BioY [Candidatus Omnitrophota bacterium]